VAGTSAVKRSIGQRCLPLRGIVPNRVTGCRGLFNAACREFERKIPGFLYVFSSRTPDTVSWQRDTGDLL